MITLEKIFSLFNLHKIDLLKIDIKGAELDVLEKFSNQDFERMSQISVEFHDFLNPLLREEVEKRVQNLQKLGYALIHTRTNFMFGTSYYNCLFYNRKYLKRFAILKLLNQCSCIKKLICKITC